MKGTVYGAMHIAARAPKAACLRGHATARRWKRPYRFFFLCLFFRKRFLRLCVAILCRFLFLPQGMGQCCLFSSSSRKRSTPLMMAVSCVSVRYFLKHAIA